MIETTKLSFTDTHTHLYLKEFSDDRSEVIANAMKAGVEAFYLPNIDSTSIKDLLDLEAAYPGRCHAMMGLHPCSVKANYEEELALVKDWLDKRPFCAVGEIGIDLYWDKSTLAIQVDAFKRQIGWAKELGLPIVVHSRESTELILEVLQDEKDERLRGILHCYTGTISQAETAWSLGFYLGIGGVVTFKNAGLDKTVEALPLEWMVLETDAPYLAPVPNRGKRNESAFVKLVAEKISEIKSIDIQTVASVTNRNAKNIFEKKT